MREYEYEGEGVPLIVDLISGMYMREGVREGVSKSVREDECEGVRLLSI